MRKFRVIDLFGLCFLCACGDAEQENIVPEPAPLAYTSTNAVSPKTDFAGQMIEGEIKPNLAVSTALQNAGMGARDIDAIVATLRPYFDWRHARPGHRFVFTLGEDSKLVWFRYEISPLQVLHAYRKTDGKLRGFSESVQVKTSTVFVEGVIDHSLYLAMDAAGEQPQLTLAFVDLFAWDIDFFTETQKKDRFRLLVEKLTVDGKFVRYGKIVAAEYTMAAGRVHRAFHYRRRDGERGYYTENGASVKKAFLKSPIQFASITSRFGMRRHPVLKYKRAHKGVDYGAPRGTAIWAIGDGVVKKAGRGGGYGNVVYIRHANGFETRYAHLKGFGRGIRSGRRVSQKQVIGYVGSTGLATGPHLHFETLKHGRHVNPLRVTVPPAPPIPKGELKGYKQAVAPFIKALAAGRSSEG
jgi:murein DD-endopeptidase MepM/ murein hydrolase activator NlpD